MDNRLVLHRPNGVNGLQAAIPAIVNALANGGLNELGGRLVQVGQNAVHNIANNVGGAVQGYYNNLGLQDRDRQAVRHQYEEDNQVVPQSQIKRAKTENTTESPMDTGGDGGAVGITGPSSGSGNPGYRGTFIGKTMTNDGREKYYHEGEDFHSESILSTLQYWTFSKWQSARPDFRWNSNPITFGVFGSTAFSHHGIVYVQIKPSEQKSYWSPWSVGTTGTVFREFDPSEHIYTQAINFSSNMLFNSKLAGNSNGQMRHYNRFRLHQFTIEVTPHTIPHSILELNPGWEINMKKNIDIFATVTADSPTNTIFSPDAGNFNEIAYMFYRDCDYLFTGSNGFIEGAPPDSLTTSTEQDKIPRVMYSVNAIQKYRTIIKNGETYSFTRKINPTGNYYIAKETLDPLKGLSPISLDKIVAELEGATNDGTIIKPLIEGFNLLYAPIGMPVKWKGPYHFSPTEETKRNFYIPYAAYSTRLVLKIRCQWEGFNFNYADNGTIPRMFETIHEPLEMAELDYKFEKVAKQLRLN